LVIYADAPVPFRDCILLSRCASCCDTICKAEYSVLPVIKAKPATLSTLEQVTQVLVVGKAFNLASAIGFLHLIQFILFAVLFDYLTTITED
jgi:hypothetical protein